MVGLRGPYATRLSIPIGISYSSGIALGYKCARYGFAVFIGGGWALESVIVLISENAGVPAIASAKYEK